MKADRIAELSSRPIRTAWLCCLMVLGGCASETLLNLAEESGWETNTTQTDHFLHNSLFKPGTGKLLHVYIEGDGRPWRGPNAVAADPTSSRLITPALMKQDKASALFLGRPCYFRTNDPACSAIWWTHQRYSQRVVDSMNAGLSELNEEQRNIVLIGHSGGGTLAWLMAAQRSDVLAVITIASNLDIEAWAAHHRYSPLSGSLNPATQPSLNAGVLQQHYQGGKDSTVNIGMLGNFIAAHPAANVQTVPQADHRCCWAEDWEQRLTGILQSITQPKT